MSTRMEQAAQAHALMVDIRRHLHQNPEVGLELPDTHDYVEAVLADLGYRVERHDSAGVTVRIEGAEPDGTVSVLRADMDALPVEERSGEPFASKRSGAMHACGHDFHMAMLLGAARVFVEHPPRHDVVLAFQPGEESDRGALRTLEHQNLQLTGPAAAFAIHVHALQPAHSINYARDTFMAFGDWFRIDFSGPGGHASAPKLTGNPIEAASAFVRWLDRFTAELSEEEAVVGTVTEFLMGNTVNVIPATGRIRGTIRSLSARQRTRLIAGMQEAADHFAAEARVSAEFQLMEGYPAVVSDAVYVDRMLERFTAAGHRGRLQQMQQPSMVIEDFSYFLQRWPGTMVYLGANVEGHAAFNHSDNAVFNEDVLSTGLSLLLIAGDGI